MRTAVGRLSKSISRTRNKSPVWSCISKNPPSFPVCLLVSVCREEREKDSALDTDCNKKRVCAEEMSDKILPKAHRLQLLFFVCSFIIQYKRREESPGRSLFPMLAAHVSVGRVSREEVKKVEENN